MKRGETVVFAQREKRAVSVRDFVPSVKVTLAVSLCTPVFRRAVWTLVVASVPLLEALAVPSLRPSSEKATERMLRPVTFAVLVVLTQPARPLRRAVPFGLVSVAERT